MIFFNKSNLSSESKYRFVFIIFFLILSLVSFAQKKPAYISGKVIDENENPLSKVTITLLGKQTGMSNHRLRNI